MDFPIVLSIAPSIALADSNLKDEMHKVEFEL